MLIFTTNYDATLERALREAGEPFHLLYYTEPEGRFAHVAPGGVVRMIERPDAIRALRPTASVIVKLNGGLIDCAPIGESFVIDIGQFERLAAQLPNVLPACVRTELERRHLLFLGHGLNESDLRKLVEFATPTKWAVQRPSASPALDRDLGQFGVSVFERELAARVPPGSALREIFEVHTPRALQRSPANRALERDLGQFNLTLIERDLGEFAAQLHTELAALR
jgi:hypothetical protein